MKLSFAFKDDLETLHSNMSKFSITLFGRTMAGKSTLMEVLTEGDGNTIERAHNVQQEMSASIHGMD